jgi:cation diffusion facilitator family transporter
MFATRASATKLSLGAISFLIALKVVVAVLTGSLSIMAQAADSFLDLFGGVVALLAVNIAVRPADREHPFGHGKVEDIGTIGQAILIIIAAGLIIFSATERIKSGAVIIMTEAGMCVMATSILVSIFLSLHLHKVARKSDSLALEASARNISADVYSATAVLAGLLIVRFTGLGIIDPILAVLVSVYILKVAYDIVKRAFTSLIDVRLPQEEENRIKSIIVEHYSKLASFHELRTRKSGTTLPRSVPLPDPVRQVCKCTPFHT